jgi:glycosyltransferase involved in cell wall biosynthesis
MDDHKSITRQVKRPKHKKMILSVIMPVFNEKDTIREIIRRVLESPVVGEIVIIDDGSFDGTSEILSAFKNHPKIKVITHKTNRGKGIAVRTGIQQVKGDLMIIQDADLEYDPRDYPRLLQPIQENLADVVYGSRFLGEARRPIYFWNRLANKILVFITNILYNNILSDMETGYKLFKREAVAGLELRARRFDFEPEITAKFLKRGVRIFEVPIRFNPRLYSEGKKIKMKDAFQAMWTLFKYRFVD